MDATQVFSKFLQETSELGDLEPIVAFLILYSGWGHVTGCSSILKYFKPKDYMRYSREAREEVCRAAFSLYYSDFRAQSLIDSICCTYISRGLKSDQSDFVKQIIQELRLWKKCGLKKDSLRGLVFNCLNNHTSQYRPMPYKTFKAFMVCGDVQLAEWNPKDDSWATEWLDRLSKTKGLKGYRWFEHLIRKHTVPGKDN